jgi:hypothetical protein
LANLLLHLATWRLRKRRFGRQHTHWLMWLLLLISQEIFLMLLHDLKIVAQTLDLRRHALNNVHHRRSI